MSFEDPEFPASDSSLYIDADNPKKAPNYIKNVQWRRVSELSSEAQMFPDDRPPQVVQGMLGDCWFLSALSVIANRPRVLNSLFRNNPTGREINPDGKYVVTFFYDQDWVDVTIDDRIPCRSDGVIAYSRAKDEDAFWVPIIEKAYAKLHGKCYQKLEGGIASQGLANIVGTIGYKIYFEDCLERLTESEETARIMSKGELGKLDASDPDDHEKFLDHMWRRFSLECALGFIFCTSKADVESGQEEATPDGLLQNHAYGILSFTQIDNVRLVQMRNPWGKTEWLGKYSDKSDAWTDKLKEEAGWKDADDGVFFMEWNDFVSEFPSVFGQVFNFDPSKWEEVEELADCNRWLKSHIDSQGGAKDFLEKGQPELTQLSFDLVGDSAGGCMNYITWRNNPQMVIKSNTGKGIDVLVQVCQKDMRHTGQMVYSEAIGFMVVKGSDDTKGLPLGCCPRLVESPAKEDIVFKSKFQYERFQTRNLHLPAFDGVYYVIGWMFKPTDDTEMFNMNIIPLTNDKTEVSVAPVTRDYAYKIEGEFDSSSGGGCPNFDTWTNNPQYSVEALLGKANVTMIMIPGDSSVPVKQLDRQAQALCVFEDTDRAGRVETWRDTLSEKPNFNKTRELVVANVAFGANPNIVIPMAYKPEMHYKYEIYVYSNSPLKIRGAANLYELWLNKDMTLNDAAFKSLAKWSASMLADADSPEEMKENVKKSFADYDKDGSKFLDINEFIKAVSAQAGGNLDEEQIRRLFDMVDANSSGTINYEQWADAVMNSTQT